MSFYPVFLDLHGKPCVVVGGGRVAERKVRALLRARASVRVIGPTVTPRLAALETRKKIEVVRRRYRKGDLRALSSDGRHSETPWLVFAATDDPATQQAIRKDAEDAGALVNLADGAEGSNFLVPASFSRGDLQIAISTSGVSPALARRLRLELQRGFDREYRAYLTSLCAARKQVMKTISDQKQRAKVLRQLAAKVPLGACADTRRERRRRGS